MNRSINARLLGGSASRLETPGFYETQQVTRIRRLFYFDGTELQELDDVDIPDEAFGVDIATMHP